MKILLFANRNKLKPVGGPLGYLYSLMKYRDKIGDKEISFLTNNILDTSITFLIRKKMVELRVNKLDGVEKEITKCKLSSKIKGRVDYNKYDIVHFHGTVELYSQREALKDYKGIVVLTTHSPKALHKELIEDCLTNEEYLRNKQLYDSAEEFDEYAFKRADYIIFPCSGAEEPYYHSWVKYQFLRDEAKIRYVPTGILPVSCVQSREEVRNKYNIPENAIVLSYVGRHNVVKGYDILKEIFYNFENIYVICCGNIGNIKPVDSERWIEVGWTNDPYSIVGASDIYMLPNRETYFDIAMLQTLCIGKCSVISYTGGNKEFIDTPGVKLYETINQAIEQISEFINMSYGERKRLEDLQRKEFFTKYTIDVFYKMYKETLKEMLEETKQNEE